MTFSQTAFGRHFVGIQIEFASVGEIPLLCSSRRVGLTRRVDHLKTFVGIIKRPVIENRRQRIAISPPILPHVDSSVCNYRTRIFKTGKPMNRIDLVRHPLTGYSRRIRPEESIFKIFARIPRFIGTIHQIALPIGIRFLYLGHQLRSSPSAGLIDVPRHLHSYYLAELARADIFASCMIIGSTAPLRTYLNNFIGFFGCFQGLVRIIHRFGKRFLAVGMTTRSHDFGKMKRMLKIGCTDNDRIGPLFPKFIGIPGRFYRLSRLSLVPCHTLVATSVPDVANGVKFKIHLFRIFQEGFA